MSVKKFLNVLVTGGAGFIGSHTVDKLVAAGHIVRVIDDLSTGNLENIQAHIDDSSVAFVNADIRDADVVSKMVKDVDVVVHLAAVTSVPFSVENPKFTREVNVEGTYSLLKDCAEAEVKRFIFISSCAVYGDPEYLPVDESHRTNPLSPYASSKLEGEQSCTEISVRSGMTYTILRLFNVYGPRQGLTEYSGVIRKFLEIISKNESLNIYGDGSQTRDFVHVTDVADAILTLVPRTDMDIFNIGSGKATSINDLAKTILQLSGKELDINYQPVRIGEILHSLANISKARKEFGYSPRVALEDGLRDFILKSRSTL